MKISRIFLSGKNLENTTLRLLENNKTTDYLLRSCEDFLEQQAGKSLELKYGIAEQLAGSITYTKKNIEELSKKIPLNTFIDFDYQKFLGVYLSALINKVVEENDKIELAPDLELNGLGMYLRKGVLLVYNNVHEWTGSNMTGGKLMIFGNAGMYAAHRMKNGILFIKGDLGEIVGFNANGGEIFVDGLVGSVTMSCHAKVYKKIRSPDIPSENFLSKKYYKLIR